MIMTYKDSDPNVYTNDLIKEFPNKREMFIFLQGYCSVFKSNMFHYRNPLVIRYGNDISFRAFRIACSNVNHGLKDIKVIPDRGLINKCLNLLIERIELRFANR